MYNFSEYLGAIFRIGGTGPTTTIRMNLVTYQLDTSETTNSQCGNDRYMVQLDIRILVVLPVVTKRLLSCIHPGKFFTKIRNRMFVKMCLAEETSSFTCHTTTLVYIQTF